MTFEPLEAQILEQAGNGPVSIEDIQRDHAWTTLLVTITLKKLIEAGLIVQDGDVYKAPPA